MDCAWDAKDENKGCMGGFQSLAFQWVFPHGGIASEADYPYEGVTNFCRKNVTLGAKFSKVDPPLGSSLLAIRVLRKVAARPFSTFRSC